MTRQIARKCFTQASPWDHRWPTICLLLVRGRRWPAIFSPGCLASILCRVSLKIRQYVSCCVLSRIPQLLVESAPGLACECSKLCDSPELLNCVCRVLCIRASLFTNPLSGQVPQCLPHASICMQEPHIVLTQDGRSYWQVQIENIGPLFCIDILDRWRDNWHAILRACLCGFTDGPQYFVTSATHCL